MTTIKNSPADVREMYLIHTGLRREYGLLGDLIKGVANWDRQRAAVVADHVTLANSILERHHRGEDKHLWPKLLTRGAREIAPLIETMEQQHQGIHTALDEVNLAAAMWRESAEPAQAAVLTGAVEVLIARLDEHLRLEEQAVLPLIRKHVTASEWDRMSDDSVADTPPEQGPLIFGMMMYEGDPAVIRGMFARLPSDIATPLAELAPKAYAEYSEKIHGTATPPRAKAA